MVSNVIFSQPITEFDSILVNKIKTYKLITQVQKTIIPIENVYGFYNDKEHPLLITVLPNHNNYKIGYEMLIHDNEKTINLAYVDKTFNYIMLPTEKDFAKVKTFFNKIQDGIHELHDIRNNRVYSTSSIRALYVDKSMWINDNGFYDIYCDIVIAGKTKTFGIYRKFLGMNKRQLFYLVDELNSIDNKIMKDNLLRVYPSSKLGMNVYNKEIILDASAVYLNYNNDFKSSYSAFNKIKEEYLDTIHNSLEAEQQELALIKNNDDVPF